MMALIQHLRLLAGDGRPGVWRAAGFETQERVFSGQEVRGWMIDWFRTRWSRTVCVCVWGGWGWGGVPPVGIEIHVWQLDLYVCV